MLTPLLRLLGLRRVRRQPPLRMATVIVAEGQSLYPLPLWDAARFVRPDSDEALRVLNELGDRYDIAYSQ